jgi:hypothetical protein
MAVRLFSGLPGAGKTAQMVAEIVRYQEQEPDRPRFYMGIRGLLPRLATELSMDQLQRWWEVLPPESVIFIDEAQEDHLMPLDHGKPKEWVKRIRKVRHEGMDFVLTVQHPCDLSPTVRRLVDQHVHTVRKFNTKVTMKYTWGRCIEKPEGERVQKAGVESIGTLPAFVFDLYDSAVSHNMKARIPRKVYYLGALLVLAVVAVISVPFMVKRAESRNVAMIGGQTPSSPGAASAAPGRSEDMDKRLRTEDFVKWTTPRVAGLPWSAPMFDNLQVKAEPRLFCVAVDDGRCSCMTEQGTKYAVPLPTCRAMVANGLYNPFAEGMRADRRERQAGSDPQAQPKAPVDRDRLPLGTSQTNHASRDTAVPYTPPEYRNWTADAFGSK